MRQTIAITGATGFAGDHALAELLKRGWRVKALVRNPAVARLPAEVEAIAGDLHDAKSLAALLRGADAVVHLAGATMALRDRNFFKVNAEGTALLAQAAVAAGTRRFIHVSSLAAGRPELSAYGASKRAGEDAVVELAVPLNALIVRPPAVYGPGDGATLALMRELTRPVAIIPSRRDSRFSLLYVTDLARILADAVTSGSTGLYELSDGRPQAYTWPDVQAVAEKERGQPIRMVYLPKQMLHGVALMVEGVARLTGRPAMFSRGKVDQLYVSDWVARGPALPLPDAVTFERGFPLTLAWYRQAGWLQRPGRTGKCPALPHIQDRP